MAASFGQPSGRVPNQDMATPVASSASQPDHEGRRFANMTETVTVKAESTHSFTVHTSLLLKESVFFKQQEKFLVENKLFDLPAPYKTHAFEIFVNYVYTSAIPQSSPTDECIDAYKLGKFLKAERFTESCDKLIRSRLFLKSPHPRLSDLSRLADLSGDPLKILILERIASLIVDGIYEATQDAAVLVHELSADPITQPVWKDLLASVILQARRRSNQQPALYGHSSRGPEYATATSGRGSSPSYQASAGQGISGNRKSAATSGGSLESGGDLFGRQQLGSTTGCGLFGTDSFGTQQRNSNTESGMSGNAKPPEASGGLFDNSNHNTNNTKSGCGLFGQGHSSSENAFGTYPTTSASAFTGPNRSQVLFETPQDNQKSWSSFGQSQQTRNAGGFPSLGTAAPKQDGLFGSPNTTTGAHGGGFGSFGVSSRTATGSGSADPSATPDAFGNYRTDPASGFRQISSGGCGGFGCTSMSRCGRFGCFATESAQCFGTNTAFKPHQEKEPYGQLVCYQSISLVPPYDKLSHEELRLNNYQEAWRDGEVKGLTSVPTSYHSEQTLNEARDESISVDAELSSKDRIIGELQVKIAQLELAVTQGEKQPDAQPLPADQSTSKSTPISEPSRSVQNLQTQTDTFSKIQEIMTKLNDILEKSEKSLSMITATDSNQPKAKALTSVDTMSAQTSGMSSPEVIFTPASTTSNAPDVTSPIGNGEEANETKEKPDLSASVTECSSNSNGGQNLPTNLSRLAKRI